MSNEKEETPDNIDEEVTVRAPVEAPSFARTKDIVDLGGKIIIGVLALCYVLGLLVVNLHLSRYGIYSLSLFRINYVIAGIWVLMPIILILVLLGSTYILIRIIPHAKDSAPKLYEFGPRNQGPEGKRQSQRLMTFIAVGILLILFLASLALAVGSIRTLIKDFGQWKEIVGTTYVICFALFTFFAISAKATATGKSLILSFAFFVVSILLLVHTIIFAKAFFPHIPSYLGGGSTKTVQLLLKLEDKDKQFFQSSGVEFNENSNQTKDLQLLFANENEYIFLVKSDEFPDAEGSTLSIDKDLIQGILYEGLKPSNRVLQSPF